MSTARFTLDQPPFAGLTGAGVRVAVIDSGIHPSNPHIGVPISGVRIQPGGEVDADFVDRIGHGTAVAAAILEKAPGVELVSVRVFDRTLATSADVLARAIDWATTDGARLINLSLGTVNAIHATVLGDAVDRAHVAGAIVVSAFESSGVRWLPGSLPNVAGVVLDASCERTELGVELDASTQSARFATSGQPRPIPGVPVQRNLSGISFAVANVSGFLARLLEADGTIRTVEDVLAHCRSERRRGI